MEDSFLVLEHSCAQTRASVAGQDGASGSSGLTCSPQGEYLVLYTHLAYSADVSAEARSGAHLVHFLGQPVHAGQQRPGTKVIAAAERVRGGAVVHQHKAQQRLLQRLIKRLWCQWLKSRHFLHL